MREQPLHVLARSLFGFLVLAFVCALITLILMLLAPPSPAPEFASLRTVILILSAGMALLLFLAAFWAFRATEEQLISISQQIQRLLGRPVPAVILVLALLEINLIASLALNSIAPAYTGPGLFLLACLSLLLAGLVVVLQRDRITDSFQRRVQSWAALGIAILLISAGAVLTLANALVLDASGLNDVLRGNLDYRPLTFIADGKEPSTAQFWGEQSQTRITWMPFVYWVVEPFDGEFIHVDAQGKRATWNNDAPDESPRIFFFGGSTMWGEGARDAYTIPSQTARLLNDAQIPAYVENYGQTGYVSTQDLLMFQFQLMRGNTPGLAIFYQGFNDTLTAYLQRYAGVSLQEDMRAADSEAGRILRSGRPLLRLPGFNLDAHDFSIAAVYPSSAASIADRWLQNTRMIAALAAAYDVRVLFVWQPALHHKQTLTTFEGEILDRMENDLPGFVDLYTQVEEELRARITNEENSSFIFLSDLFKDDTRSIFYDLVHITEEGNAVIAQALHDRIMDLLSSDD